MTVTIVSFILGLLIFVFALASFIINTLVLSIIWQSGFLKKLQNTIYIFIFATLVGNALQMAIAAFYLGPSAIAQVKKNK